MFPKSYFPNGENPNAVAPKRTSVPALGRHEVETSNANRRGLMVTTPGLGLYSTSAFVPAVTAVALGMSYKAVLGR